MKIKGLEYSEFELTERQSEVILLLAKKGHTTKDNGITQTAIESQIGYHRDVLRPQLDNFLGYGLFESVQVGERMKYYVTEFGRFAATIVLINEDIRKTQESDLVEFFPFIKRHMGVYPKQNADYRLMILGQGLMPRFYRINQLFKVEIVLPVTSKVRLACHYTFNEYGAEQETIMERIRKISNQFYFTQLATDLGEFGKSATKMPSEVKKLLQEMFKEIDSEFDLIRMRIGDKIIKT